MSPHPPPERFRHLIDVITRAVVAHTGWDQRMSLTLIGLITERLRGIKWTFLRLAACIQAGRYRRRAVSPRPRDASGHAPPIRGADPLPKKSGWLEDLLPETVQFRGFVDQMLRSPEMEALIRAAPDALGRPLRSLCRMIGLRPPPILARPPRAAPAPTPAPTPAQRKPRGAKPPTPQAPPRVRAAPAPAKTPAIAPALRRRKPA